MAIEDSMRANWRCDRREGPHTLEEVLALFQALGFKLLLFSLGLRLEHVNANLFDDLV